MYYIHIFFLFFVFSPNGVVSRFSNSFKGGYFACICNFVWHCYVCFRFVCFKNQKYVQKSITLPGEQIKTKKLRYYRRAILEWFLLMLHMAFYQGSLVEDLWTIEVVDISYLKENWWLNVISFFTFHLTIACLA